MSNNNYIIEVIELIEEKMGKYRTPLGEGTTLEKDLGMTGDDADEFLISYGKKFNVDLTNFNFNKYFLPEGDTILPALIRLFTNKKNPKSLELTIGDLVKGIIAGKLDDEVINANSLGKTE